MVTAVFTDNDDYSHAYGLWQWDYGQQLRIEGLHLPTAVEIHFALQETGGEAIPRVGTTKDGVTTVTIPDSMLEGNSTVWTAEKAYNIYAWIYLSDQKSGETIKRITMRVKSRPKPKAFEAPGDGEIFREAIEAVNDAAKRAEDAGDKAIAAADEAKAAATQTAEHLQVVQGLAEQVETNADTVAQDKQAVTGMLSQAQQAASDAALSAQEAKLSETAAVQAQTGAEAAEDGARQYAEETGADRQAVANDKQTVTQMREDVAADRQAVEQTAAQFGQTSQDALTAIGQAQSTAVGAVKAEGQKQTTAVQEAGTQAVSEVTEAKTTAVEAVTTEGDTQTKRVEDAAAGIIADREQISQNKTDIAGLVEGMTDLAPAIHSTASGSVITANDATEGRPFRGLRVFGRTEQVRTEGAQLLDESKVEQNNFRAFKCINLSVGEGSFTLSSNIPKSPTDSSAYIMLISGNVQEISPENTTATNGVYKGQSRTFPSINGYVTIAYRNDSYANNIINFNGYWYMLNKGAEEKPYEPYTGGKPSPSPEYPQEIVNVGESGSINVEVGGGNLFKILQHSAGYYTGEPGSPVQKNANTGYSWEAELLVLPGTELTLSVITSIMSRFRCYVIDDNGIILLKHEDSSANSVDYTHTFVVPDRGAKMYLSLMEVSAPEGTTIMLNSGKAALPYEPYRAPQTLTLQTPNGLPGIPVSKDGNYTDENGQQWVCDEIDLGRGKYVQRIIEKDVLETQNTWAGMGNWGNVDAYSTLAFLSYADGTNGNKSWDAIFNAGMCNYFLRENGVYKNSKIAFSIGNYIAFRVPRSLLPDWDENNPSSEPWVNWLRKRKEAGNPLLIQYALKTPFERDLTPEEIAAYKALRTYGPTTVVSSDAGAEMEATYVADTGKYIQNLEERLNAKMVNIQSALISQKTSGGGAFNNSR